MSRKIPVADHFDVHTCDSCDNPHLTFYDSSGRILCQAAIPREELAKLAAEFSTGGATARSIGVGVH